MLFAFAAYAQSYKTSGSQPGLQPVRIIGTNGVIPFLASAQTTRTQFVARIPVIFGCPATELTLAFDNFYLQAGTPVVETNLGQAMTIVKVALENTSPTTFTPIKFGGLAGTTLADGASNQHSDTLTISLVPNQLYWIRITGTIPAAGNLPEGANTGINYAGTASYLYPPANDIDQVYATGAMTAPSGSLAQNYGYGPSAILGRCATAGHLAVANIGASWSVGNDDYQVSSGGAACADSGNMIATGYGLMPHAALGAGGAISGAIPYTKITQGGSGAAEALTWTKSVTYLQYANVLFDDMGANDVPGGVAATIYNNNLQMWQNARAVGVERIVVMQMNQRTSSTDNWATAANQTPGNGFNTGQVGDQINTMYQTAPIDGQLTLATTQDSSTRWKWLTDGTAYKYTCQGVHPNLNSYPLMGAELRSILQGLSIN